MYKRLAAVFFFETSPRDQGNGEFPLRAVLLSAAHSARAAQASRGYELLVRDSLHEVLLRLPCVGLVPKALPATEHVGGNDGKAEVLSYGVTESASKLM